jgi:hypothetical protein
MSSVQGGVEVGWYCKDMQIYRHQPYCNHIFGNEGKRSEFCNKITNYMELSTTREATRC